MANKTIFKEYIPDMLDLNHCFTVETRKRAKVLFVGQDPDGESAIWMEVDREAKIIEKVFHVIGTSGSFPDDKRVRYVGTYIKASIVWHLYEEV